MLKIKCPSCSSQFSVGEEFLGKYVECGSCEYQFTVAEIHLADDPKKNHYPVRKHSDLTNFSKTFDAAKGVGAPITSHDKHLSKLKQDDFMPEPLWKKATTILGWFLLVGGIFLLVVGSLKNGFLTDVGYEKRFVIAGFIALVSSVCFILGSKFFKNALPLCFLSVLVMAALAYFLPMYELPTSNGKLQSAPISEQVDEAKAEEPEDEYLSITKLKKVCRYEPVEQAIQAAQKNGDENADSVVAIWVQDVAEEQQYAIQDYFKNALGLKNRPNYYIRKDGALLVIESLSGYTVQDIAQISDIFGPMKDIYVTQRILAIQYEKDRFANLNTELSAVLSDTENPAFYSLNFKEAEHFDSNRVLAALKRLKVADPRRTADATVVYHNILRRYKDSRIIDAVSECILNWSGDDPSQHLSALDSSARYKTRKIEDKSWSKNFLLALLRAGSTQAPAIALELWSNNPTEWEKTLINSQRDFTGLVVKYIDPEDRARNLSIINVLAKTKSANSKALLQSLKGKLDSSYSVAIDHGLGSY